MLKQTYEGCSLDVFTECLDDIAEERLSYRIQYGASVGDVITRYTTTWAPVETEVATHGVDHFVASVDANLQSVAAAIGAQVVPHTWGLIKRTSACRYYEPSLECFGIKDYLLGAKVAVIPGRPMSCVYDEGCYDQIAAKLKAAGSEFLAENGWTILDITRPENYTTHSINTYASLTLHDIEPRVLSASSFHAA